MRSKEKGSVRAALWLGFSAVLCLGAVVIFMWTLIEGLIGPLPESAQFEFSAPIGAKISKDYKPEAADLQMELPEEILLKKNKKAEIIVIPSASGVSYYASRPGSFYSDFREFSFGEEWKWYVKKRAEIDLEGRKVTVYPEREFFWEMLPVVFISLLLIFLSSFCFNEGRALSGK